MPTVGNTNLPNGSWWFYGSGNSNMLAIKLTMPETGLITSITGYFAGHGQTINPRMVIWDTSGNVLAQSGQLTVGSGGASIDSQGWQTGSVSLVLTGGTQFYIGFWRPSNQSQEWTENNSGTEYQFTDSSNSTVPHISSWNSTSGTPSFYATYTQAPSITSMSASQGNPGQAVTISGAHFGSTQGAGSVTFNGVSAAITSWSDASIICTVPSFSTTTNANVVVNQNSMTSNGWSFLVQVGGVKNYQAGSFQKYKAKVYQSGTFQWYAVKTWDGTKWTRRA